LDFAQKSRDLKIVQRSQPSYFEKFGIKVFDLRFQNKVDEDKLYEKSESYIKYIRRGNSIMRLPEKNGLVEYAFLRKGLNKFFDYRPTYSQVYSKLQNRVIGNIIDNFKVSESAKPVVVYETYKANGENFQVSYVKEFDSWAVCSKQVTLLAHSIDDIKEMNGIDQFTFCVYFVQLWFQTLKELFGDNKDKLDEFKQRVTGFTLVGESVGDPNHQHIKIYSKAEFLFYAIVDNDSQETPCMNFEYSTSFLAQYGFQVVSFKKSPLLNTLDEFNDYMEKRYYEVLNYKVDEHGEGKVCYFAIVNDYKKLETFNKISNINTISSNSTVILSPEELECLKDNIEIVSMGKLKTFEYKFFRKMREKLKYFIKHKGSIASELKAIEKETDNVLDNKEGLFDFSAYLKFAEFMFAYIKKNLSTFDFANKYGSLLEQSKKSFFLKYPNFKLDLVIKTDPYQKNIYHQDLELVENENEGEGKKDKDGVNLDLPKSLLENVSVLDSKCIYLIAALGVVGSGKSTVYNSLNKLILSKYNSQYSLSHVSSDGIQEELYKEMLIKNPSLTFQDAFGDIKLKVKNVFNNRVFECIEKADPKKVNFIFLDKNFPMNQLGSQMKLFQKKGNVKIMVFYPNIPSNTNLGNVPYSLNFITQCYHRIKNRKHETLDASKNKDFYMILFFFLSLNKGKGYQFEFKDNFKREWGYFPINMTDESELLKNQDVEDALYKILTMRNNTLFKEKEFSEEYESELKLVIEYFEEVVKEREFKSTIEQIERQMEFYLSSWSKKGFEIDEFMEEFKEIKPKHQKYENRTREENLKLRKQEKDRKKKERKEKKETKKGEKESKAKSKKEEKAERKKSKVSKESLDESEGEDSDEEEDNQSRINKDKQEEVNPENLSDEEIVNTDFSIHKSNLEEKGKTGEKKNRKKIVQEFDNDMNDVLDVERSKMEQEYENKQSKHQRKKQNKKK